MITKFDSLFAGYVDFDNMGYAGTPVNDRWFSNDYLITAYDKARDICQLMDRLGYDTFWGAEHHFQREGYEVIPNILMFNLHLAHVTKNIRLGCGFNITPMWHPLRLAEDFAFADILSGGRLVFGVGRGYHTREVEVFGSPLRDQEANMDLFEEQVSIIMKAFHEESFSHQGKHYQIPPEGIPYRGYELKDITLVPRPLRQPVECWQPIQSVSQRGMNFMAKHGIKAFIGGGVDEGGAAKTVVEGWRDIQASHGIETILGENLCVGFHFHIADTQEKAVKEATPWFEEHIKLFGPLRLGPRALTAEQLRGLGDPKTAPFSPDAPHLDELVKTGSWLYGPPEKIIERLMEVEEMFPGLERIDIEHPVSTPRAVILEQMEWFANEVMPAFKGRVELKTTTG